MSGHHLSLSLSREMWNEILQHALPVQVAEGEFDLVENARSALRQLQVRERVVGLLEQGGERSGSLVRFTERARRVWRDRRPSVYGRLKDLVSVQGTWTVEVDQLGTDLKYGQQRVGADAFVKGVATGRITFLRENVVVPFRIERRIGASLSLARIRYSQEREGVIGNVEDLALHLGDNAVLQLLSRLIEYTLEQQVALAEPVKVLSREQVAGLVSPMGGALQLEMGVDDLQLDINGEDLTLRVRFGFSRPADRQLADKS